MNSVVLNNFLKEYENKRMQNLKRLEERKKQLFSENSRLKEIEGELGKYSISTLKLILCSNNPQYINNLKEKVKNLKKEKNSILKQMGKNYNYLEPIFECKSCKDTGYITELSNTKMCNCLKQKIFNIEYNKCNIKNLQKENFENFNYNLYSDKCNAEKYKSEISPRENIKIIKNATEKFIKDIENEETRNLIFVGGTGLGKTFLSNCIANEILKMGKTVLYQTAPTMLDVIINNMFEKNESQSEITKSLYNVDLLIIDDLGTETMNSMKFTELYKIINTRILNRNTKTIISTNLDLQNLFSQYDERIVSRIVGYYDAYRFFGEDIRFLKKC